MSLISLTFGDKKNSHRDYSQHNSISTPGSRLSQKIEQTCFAHGEGIIKKTCQFYAQDDVFALIEVTNGLVAENMLAFVDNKPIQMVELESKYGNNAKKGMVVGITFKGITENELEKGKTISFKSG